jgi:hypothetical protein
MRGVAVAWLIGAAGCVQHTVGFVPIGTVTVRVAPEQEADVVWLLKQEGKGGTEVVQRVLRCHNAEQGPVCVPAKVAE